jgi:hypothetical protein
VKAPLFIVALMAAVVVAEARQTTRRPDVRFLPTPDNVVDAMLELARVGPADVAYPPPSRMRAATTRGESTFCVVGDRRGASNFSPFGSLSLRHARTRNAVLLRILEAPPGFEPGMEVLQISRGSLSY